MPANAKPLFLDQLKESQLLEPAQLDELAKLPEAKDADPRRLAKQVFQRGWLTKYQINQVVAGKAKDLFVGQYVLLERLGEGGMGQVFKAQHRHMGRVVALKLIRKEKLQSDAAVQRFFAEMRAAAQLSHPNIALAYDAGQAGNTHYLAMEYVEGADLAQLVKDRGPLPVAEACEYVRQAALGLQHAHDKGMVHRDIKPHNLLVTSSDGAGGKSAGAARAVVKILDMGLARSIQGDFDKQRGLTQQGALIGTPDYLAPEQAVDSRAADIRADLYSLGCTLYFLLAGRPPFQAEMLTQLLLKHQMEEATPVEKLRPDVPAAVAAIVRRLMAKRPEQRFQTPAELAQALEAAPRGGAAPPAPVRPPAAATARAEPEVDAFWNTVVEGEDPPARSRHEGDRTLATARGGRAPRSRRAEEQRKKLLLLGGLAAIPVLVLIAVVIALAAGGGGDGGETPKDAAHKDAQKDKDEGGGEGPVAAPGAEEFLLAGHKGKVTAVAFSPDGTRAASGGEDRTLRVWDFANRQELCRISGLPAEVRSVAFTPNGQHLLATTADGALREFDWAQQKEVGAERSGQTLSPSGRHSAALETGDDGKPWVRFRPAGAGGWTGFSPTEPLPDPSMAFSGDDARAVLAGRDGTIYRYDLLARRWGRFLTRLDGVACVACAPDGRSAVFGRVDGSIHLIDLASGRVSNESVPGRGPVRSAAFTPDGRRALLGSTGWVVAWDVAAKCETERLEGHKGDILSLAVAANGRHAVSGGADGSVRVWDLTKLSELPEPPRPPGVVARLRAREFHSTPRGSAIAFSPDGTHLVSGHDDHVRLWDAATRKDVHTFDRLPALVRSLAFSGDGKRLFANWGPSAVRFWNVETKSEGSTTSPAAFLSPDGRFGASADTVDGKPVVKVWSLDEAKEYHRFEVPNVGGARAVFTPDGSRLLLLSQAGFVQVLELQKKQLGHRLSIGGPGAVAAAGSADGRRALLSFLDNSVRLFDLVTGAELKSLEGHARAAKALALSPSGDRALSAASDNTLRLWDLEAGRELARLEGPSRPVLAVAFSPDGKRAAAAGVDGGGFGELSAAVVERPPAAPERPGAVRWIAELKQAQSVAYSPDGTRLATGADNALFVLDARTGKEAARSNISPTPGNVAFGPGGKTVAACTVSATFVLDVESVQIVRRRGGGFVSPDGRFAVSFGQRPRGEAYANVWALEDNSRPERITIPNFRSPARAAFSADGSRLAINVNRGRVIVHDVAGKKEVGRFTAPDSPFEVALSPDGRTVLLAHGTGPVSRWSVESGKELGRLNGHTQQVTSLTFSPDGRRALTVGADGTVRLWEVDGGKELASVKPEKRVVQAAFAPDGRQVALASPDGIGLWDLDAPAAGDGVPVGRPLHVLRGHARLVTRAQFLSDGRLLSASVDSTVRLWGPKAGREERRFDGVPIDGRLAVFPNNQEILFVTPDNKHIQRYDLRAGRPTRLYDENKVHAVSVAVSADGKQFATAGGAGGGRPDDDHHVRVWEAATGRLVHTLRGHSAQVSRLVFTPDGRHVVSGAGDGVRVWDRAAGKQALHLSDRFMALSEDGRLAVLDGPQGPALWDTDSGRRLHDPVRPPMKRIEGAAVVGRERVLFWGLSDADVPGAAAQPGLLWLFDVKAGRVLRRFEGHAQGVFRVSVSPDGRLAASGGHDGLICVWEMGPTKEAPPPSRPVAGKDARRFEGHTQEIVTVAVTRDGKKALSAGRDNTVRLWDATTGKEAGRLADQPGAFPVRAALSPDGRWAALATPSTVRLFSLNPLREAGTLRPGHRLIRGLVFAPDGRSLLTYGTEAPLSVWNLLATPARSVRFEGHTDDITCAAFSADGRWVVSGSRDRSVRLWEARTGKMAKRFEGHTEALVAVAVSPDGKTVYSVGRDRTLRAWGAEKGESVKSVDVPGQFIRNAALHGGTGRALVTGLDTAIQVWDVKEGKLLTRLEGHTAAVLALEFAEGGRHAVSGGDLTVRLWDLPAP